MYKECIGQVPVEPRRFKGYSIEKAKSGIYINTDSGETFYILGNKTSWKYIEQAAEWLVNDRYQEAPQCVNDFFYQINHYNTEDGKAIDSWTKGIGWN